MVTAVSLAVGTVEEWVADFEHVSEDPLHRCPGLGNIVDTLEGADKHTKLMNKIDRCLTSGKIAMATSGGAQAEAVMMKVVAQGIKMQFGHVIEDKLDREGIEQFFLDNPQYVDVALAALCTHPNTANI